MADSFLPPLATHSAGSSRQSRPRVVLLVDHVDFIALETSRRDLDEMFMWRGLLDVVLAVPLYSGVVERLARRRSTHRAAASVVGSPV